MSRSRLPTLALVLLCAVPEAFAAGDVAEVEQCMRSNLPERSLVQTVTLDRIDRTGAHRTLEARIQWKRRDEERYCTLIEIDAPPDDRGSAYLLVDRGPENDMFSYLPELKRVRRVNPRQASDSIAGLDLSFEDLSRMQELSGTAASERLPDAGIEGRPVFVVRSRPAPEEASAYERIDYHVDRESCVPLRIEFYRPGEELAKRLTADAASIGRSGKGWVAKALRVENPTNGTETRIRIEKIDLDTDVPDHICSEKSLIKRH